MFYMWRWTAMSRLRSERDRLTDLYAGYPQLADLHRVLSWILLDAHPIVSSGDDYGTRIQSQGTPTPGAGTHRQRARLARTQRLLTEWTERLENDLDGQTPRRVREKRPRCYADGTDHYGLRLGAGAKYCSKCGAPTGKVVTT